MRNHFKKSLLLFVTALLVAGGVAAAAGKEAEKKDQWEEEILLQLSEMRKAQGELIKRVDSLQAEVTALRAAGAGAAGGANGAATLDLRDPQFPSEGDAKAQVAIVEFSDFQCPYCRRHQQATLPTLAEQYVNKGTVRYFFVDYPLSFHAQALGAAIAAACAHQQGAFWKMHDQLFDNQGKLGDELYRKLATDLKLDEKRFQSCVADPKTKQMVTAHLAIGDRLGVDGTPAFLVGKLKDGVLTDARRISGARPASDFEKLLKQYVPGS